MHNRLFRRLLIAAIAAWAWLASTDTALAQTPQYGGTLCVCTIYCTLSPLSWDLANWNWKQADDTGHYYERLFSAALSKAIKRSSAPALKWSQWVEGSGSYLSLRMDTKPFDGIRVRRALNIAIEKAAIVNSYYGGHAELFAYPMHPDWTGYYEPLAAMPAWWPWAKNYGGELLGGGGRPAPVYARVRIDQAMKKRMGYD
jgi:hypothetical protein